MNFSKMLEQISWFPSLKFTIIDIVQIVIITIGIYCLMRSIYKTRGWILLKGILCILGIYAIVVLTKMTTIQAIMQGLFSVAMIAIVVMFQPELQRIIEVLGRNNFKDFKSMIMGHQEKESWCSDETINQIADACEAMSKDKVGALIILEKSIPLTECIRSGIPMKSLNSSQLLINIFVKNTPLHDGAVVIRNNKIEAATCILPLSGNGMLDKSFGTRHRAAVGVTEESDAVAVVVSEETGGISIAYDGKVKKDLSKKDMIHLLTNKMEKNGDLFKKKREHKTPKWMKYSALVIGLITWMCVTMITDPVYERVMSNIPVTTINTNVLDDQKQTYTITSGQTVDVKLKGIRSQLMKMTRDDITATADFTNLSVVGAVPIDVSIKNNIYRITATPNQQNMKIKLEETVQIEVPLEVKIINDTDNKKIIKITELETDTIMITCAKSLSDTIDKGVLVVDAAGKDKDFVVHIKPIFYDKNGSEVTEDKLSLNDEMIDIWANVYEVKEVPLTITMKEQNTDADTYFELNSLTAGTDKIKIGAENKIMDELKEINIEINPDENSKTNDSIIIKLAPYLPEGVFLAKDQNDQVEIKLELKKYEKQILQIGINDIEFVGYNPEEFNITVVNKPENIIVYRDVGLIKEKIKVTDLKPTIKVTNTNAGTFDAVLEFTDVEGITVKGDLNVKFSLEGKEEE